SCARSCCRGAPAKRGPRTRGPPSSTAASIAPSPPTRWRHSRAAGTLDGMASWRRVAVISSASGNGKTTMGRELAGRLGVPFIEVDALVHGPSWTETPNDVLAQRLVPVLASEGWVVDNAYRHKLGDLVLEAADVVVWLDLPMRVWLPRLVRRAQRRLTGREALWNGNRESLRGAMWGRDSLFGHALRTHFARRR